MRRLAAPLAPGFRAAPLWHDGVTTPDSLREDRPLPTSAEVVVVGGGYCGVTAAGAMARGGVHAVVLEADAIAPAPDGRMASTRNGGMVIPELKHGPRALTRRYGPLGRRLVDAVLEAFDLVERIVRERSIDCAYARTGGLLLAHHDRQLPGLRVAAREWTDDLGEPAHLVPRDELHSELGSDAYRGGLVIDKTGGLDPARYHAGLVRDALDAGAELHARARVTALERRVGGGFFVRTVRGTVEARDVLVAANASVDGAMAPLRRFVLPVGSFIIATEPLDADLARAVIPHGRMCFDTRHLLSYWRLSPDRRMVFGGRTSLAATTVGQAQDALYAAMVHVHPQLAGVRVTHAWGGDVAITRDRLPHCGRIDGIAYATGCNGTGIALATWFGVRAAEWLAGDEPPVFAELSMRRIPFHRWRAAWLPAAGWGLHALDRSGR